MDKFLVENGQVFRQVFSRENGQFFSRKQTSKSNLENLVLRAGNGQGQTGPVQIEGGPKTLRGGGQTGPVQSNGPSWHRLEKQRGKISSGKNKTSL
jgi:hypothetical protein